MCWHLVRDYELIQSVPFNSWKPTVFACNMRTERRNVTIDAQSGNVSQSNDLTRSVRTTWQQWEQPEISNDTLALIVSTIQFSVNRETRTISRLPVGIDL